MQLSSDRLFGNISVRTFVGAIVSVVAALILLSSGSVPNASAAKRCGKVDAYRTAKVVRGKASCKKVRRVVRRYVMRNQQTSGWYCWSPDRGGAEVRGLTTRCKRRGTTTLVNVYFRGEGEG